MVDTNVSAVVHSESQSISTSPKQKPRKPEPRYPDFTHFYHWVVAHPESPLHPILKNSGYHGDPVFIDRTIRGYDFFTWRWFYTRRGVDRDVFRAEWAKFVADAWRKLTAEVTP